MTQGTTPKPFVFVLMPFDETFEDSYRLAIKPACEAAGAYAERVDEQIFQDSMLQRIYNQIAKADLIVADMTGRNPNVFYETGYAHALGKPVVLLTHAASDIPFDLKHYPHIVYQGKLSTLKTELERRIRYLLEAKGEAVASNIIPIEVTVNDVTIDSAVVQRVRIRTKGEGRKFNFLVTVRHPAVRYLQPVDFQIALVSPANFEKAYAGATNRTDNITLAQTTRVHLFRRDFSILPGAWERILFWTMADRNYAESEIVDGFAVRIFTTAGFYDFPFQGVIELGVPGTA